MITAEERIIRSEKIKEYEVYLRKKLVNNKKVYTRYKKNV